MDNKKVARELIKIAKSLLSQDEMTYMEFNKKYPTLKKKIQFAKENGGSVKKWRLGSGWQEVIDYNTYLPTGVGSISYESSGDCILYATLKMAESLGITKEVAKLIKSKMGFNNQDINSLKEWSILCQIPNKWDKKNLKLLLGDLEDVNYHHVMRGIDYILNEIGDGV